MEERANARMSEARAAVAALAEKQGDIDDIHQPPSRAAHTDVDTAVPADVLLGLNEQLLTVPEGFTVHPKLMPQLERRREAMGEDGGILWAHAEALAMASLLVDGVPVRLTGQDSDTGNLQPAAPARCTTLARMRLDAVHRQDLHSDGQSQGRRRQLRSCSTARCPRRRRSASSTATAPSRPRRW